MTMFRMLCRDEVVCLLKDFFFVLFLRTFKLYRLIATRFVSILAKSISIASWYYKNVAFEAEVCKFHYI